MQTVQQHRAEQAHAAADLEAERKRLIKLCQTAKRDRKWDEDTWLAIKREHAEVDSLADADIAGCEAILAHAKARGFHVRHATPEGGKSRPIDRTDPARKLRKLWLRAHQLGIVKDKSEAALCSWASNSRAPNVSALLESFGDKEWLAAIERLKKWLYRELLRGRLACSKSHIGPVDTKAATAIIWERGLYCVACQGKALAEWQPAPKQPERRSHGRRG